MANLAMVTATYRATISTLTATISQLKAELSTINAQLVAALATNDTLTTSMGRGR